MDALAIGFWGAFFGSVALMLGASLLAFARSLHRVALTAALSAMVSALFAVTFLGWLPGAYDAAQARLQAHVATLSSVILGLMLLAMLGLLRRPQVARKARRLMASLAAVVLGVGWSLAPAQSRTLSAVMAFVVGVVLLVLCVRSASRGDRLAWVAVLGVCCMLVALGGLSWIARDAGSVPWQVHAVSALAGMVYLATMAMALWMRYSYLIELRDAVSHGPSYDPVTRMRSHAETGPIAGLAFFRRQEDVLRPVGVIVISIGNLYTLENLHGRAALNHALFVCASRLRRCVPLTVEMGRIADDGFMMVVRDGADLPRLVQMGRLVNERLSRPVVLRTSLTSSELEAGKTDWVAQVGVGILVSTAHVKPADAVSMARAMSRTAWSYASRLAWYDLAAGRITEVPVLDAA